MVELIVIAVCLILNAILSCVEMAFVTVSKPHLKKLSDEGDKLSKRVLRLKSNPERVLSVLQIGITLVGAISAAVGGAGAEEILSPAFQKYLNVTEEIAESLAIVSVVLPITFFSVVIGELVPKTLALRFPMKFARFGATFLQIMDKIFSPLVSVLEFVTKLILKILYAGVKSETIADETSSVDIDNLSLAHKQYVLNLIDVDKRKAKDIMLPWEKVIKLDQNSHPSAVLETIKKSGHTRLPVMDNDNPIGILLAKEFISESEVSKIDWLQLARPIIFVNPDEPILSTLKTLQSTNNHMAIVISDMTPIGIVTLEDIFEEVVGEIYDEDDNPRVLLSSNSRIRTMNLGKK